MPQSKKISPQSSFVRFMAGSIMTAFGTARLMRNPRSRAAQGLVVLGAMQAAQGATGYCPTKGMMSNLFTGKMGNLTQSASNMAQKMTGGSMQQATSAVQNAVPEVGQLMKDFSNAIAGTTAGQNASSGQTGTTAGKTASSSQTGTTSGSSKSGNGTKAATSNTTSATNNTKAASSFKDGAPSDDMMKEVADKVISAASKNTHSPQITH